MVDLCVGPAQLVCAGVDAVTGAAKDVAGAVGGVADAGVQAVSFASDPLGFLVQKLQEGIHAVAAEVIPYLLKALEPDYTAEWWRSSYAVSFGVALVVLAFLMIGTAIRRVRGEIGPRALLESYFFAIPAFLVGASFGPLVGIVVTKFFTAMAGSLALFFLDTTTSDFWKTFADRVSDKDAGKLGGSAMLSLLIFSVLMLALLGVAFILVIQLATQYLIGALIPLGLVWLAHPDTRSKAKIGPLIWISILMSHVLLILVLGIAFKAINGLLLTAQDNSADLQQMKTLVNIAVPTVLMAMVVLAPMSLMKLAKWTTPGNGGGQSSQGGLSTPHQAPQPGRQMQNAQQVADRQSRSSSSSSGGGKSTPASPAMKTSGQAGSQAATAGKAATAAGGKAAAGSSTMAAAGKAATATGVGAPIGMSLMVMDAAIKVAHRASRAAEQAASQAGDAGDERHH
ncbi:hypothetical protein [Agreia sp. COWG]|uniref:hypothetical protein n=1 Tax=Agreia sp. COWG TaxID=2773266 RepID=UPI0019260845|nr:hypothetical protein [Agreia sp. COWG]CAD6016037.1 conserved membrane protein of unknown function [Agreia sp. COWG]